MWHYVFCYAQKAAETKFWFLRLLCFQRFCKHKPIDNRIAYMLIDNEHSPTLFRELYNCTLIAVLFNTPAGIFQLFCWGCSAGKRKTESEWNFLSYQKETVEFERRHIRTTRWKANRIRCLCTEWGLWPRKARVKPAINPIQPKKRTKTRYFFRNNGFFVELAAGLEPATCALRMRCSTNWATQATIFSDSTSVCQPW